jgi:putative addiction module killer protein
MISVRTTEVFDEWFRTLRDRGVRARIQARIDRLELGNFGQHRELKGGVGELKLDFGPGYRIYYSRFDRVLVILLCGGNKSTQAADIALAAKLAKLL